MSKKRHLPEAGETNNRLTIIEVAGRTVCKKLLVRCRCTCGNETILRYDAFRRGGTKSCGCILRERTYSSLTKADRAKLRKLRAQEIKKAEEPAPASDSSDLPRGV